MTNTVYLPQTCVWEVTMGCNMRCKHCGSSCENALEGELNTQEAFKFIDMCHEMGLMWVTISGGEPLTRKDLPLLIKRFSDKGILVNIITNGWLMNNSVAQSLKESGICTVAISVDGTEKIHDKIRKQGSFARVKEAFKLLKKHGISRTCVTTISNQNLHNLNDLKNELISIGVDSWQLQIGVPMGNFADHQDWVIKPEDMNKIIDFICETRGEGKICVYPADCIGYYNQKLIKAFKNDPMSMIWDGCNAGIRSFGILHNGDIVGCTSIRDKSFIEGNIKNMTLKEIWDSPNTFLWRRNQTKDCLKGDCKICKYATRCLGGCANVRLTINRELDSENLHCSYNLLMKKLRKKLSLIYDFEMLLNQAQKSVDSKQYQEAMFLLNRAVEINPKNNLALELQTVAKQKCADFDFS